MDLPNAFIGETKPPSSRALHAMLGPSAAGWSELIAWLTQKGIECDNWSSVSPKYGWSLRPLLKKRTILWMGPCKDCFRVSFALSDKAVATALASKLPKALHEQIASARRYAEGTPVRLVVKSARDLAPVRALVEIKLEI
jgi:hypothetical protein